MEKDVKELVKFLLKERKCYEKKIRTIDLILKEMSKRYGFILSELEKECLCNKSS